MPTKLYAMKIREVSFVDDPASPGADIILTKQKAPVVLFKAAYEGQSALKSFRDFYELEPRLFDDIYKAGPSDEARDEHGRWTAAADSLRSGLKTLGAHARGTAQALAAGAGHILRSTRLTSVQPVAGTGLHFEFSHRTKSGAMATTRVQIHPEHVAGKAYLTAALTAADKVLRAYGRPAAPKITTGLGAAKFEGSVGVASPSPSMGNTGWSGMQGRTAASATAPPRWQEQPRRDATGAALPLTGKNPNTSGQNAYYTTDGDFVPAAPTHIQEAIERALKTPPFPYESNKMTSAEANGQRAYFTTDLDFVPHTSVERQKGIEAQYAQENARQAAATTAALRDDFPITKLPTVPHEPNLLFPTSKRSSLFKANFKDGESRDARGRWAAATGAVADKVKSTLSTITPGHVAGVAASFVAGRLGVPDEVADHAAHHVKTTIDAAVSRIESDPRYQRFAQKVRHKAKTLFSKSTLGVDDHEELKRHIVNGMRSMPIHAEIAGSDTALAAVVQGVHHALYRSLCNRQEAV